MSNSFMVNMWEPGGVMRQKQERDFNSTFEEYKSYVVKHKRFPTSTNDTKTSRGTSLYGWRAKVKGNKSVPPHLRELLINFENDMQNVIKVHEEQEEVRLWYDNLVESNRRSYDGTDYPKTLEEYLEEDNRFKYFNVQFYMDVMERLNLPTIPELGEIRLIMAIFGERHWSFIYYEVGLDRIAERLHEALETLKYERGKPILKIRFGLWPERGKPKCLAETAEYFALSRERIRQIEAKGLREMRHPSRSRKLLLKYSITDEMYDAASRNKIGHWFIISTPDNEFISKFPMDKLEEALELQGFDIDEAFPKYHLKSVETTIEHEAKIGINMLRRLGIKPSTDGRGIELTRIQLTKADPPFDTIKYIKETVEEAERQARIATQEERNRKIREEMEMLHKLRNEEMERLFEEQRLREEAREAERIARLDEIRRGVQEVAPVPPKEYERLKAQWKQDVQGMIKYIRFDTWTWVNEINAAIKPYQISTDLLIMAQQVLLREIEFWGGKGKTDGYEFMVQCTNLGLDANDDYEFMYRMQLKRKG